jgi:hypothetical protein
LNTTTCIGDGKVAAQVKVFETGTISALEFFARNQTSPWGQAIYQTCRPLPAFARRRQEIRAFAAHHGTRDLSYEARQFSGCDCSIISRRGREG